MDQRCDCFCHMPGCVVTMPDGGVCCFDYGDEIPPHPRAAMAYPPGVSDLSPNAPQGFHKAEQTAE